MRVLHFYKTYHPDSVGGVEQVIRQMCVGTGRLGVSNTVLSLSRHDNLVPFEFEGHMVPAPSGYRRHMEIFYGEHVTKPECYHNLPRYPGSHDYQVYWKE